MTAKTLNHAKKLSEQYAFHTRLIQDLVDEVSDSESLLQPPFEANCLNWILGHIISRRHSALEALDSEPLWRQDRLSRYRTGSEPITSRDRAVPFDTLLDDLERSFDMLQHTLDSADDALLERTFVNDRGEKTAVEHVEGFLWHETYHIGQLEILRAFIKSSRH